MPSVTVQDSTNIASIAFSNSTTYTEEGQVTLSVLSTQLDAGDAGSLTTRTSATEGVITTTAAHGILDTATIDIIWTDGYRYGCDIDSVTSDTITFSGGAGDDLPIQDTAVSACEITNAIVEFDGDDCSVIGIKSANQGMTVSFKDDGDAVIGVFRLTSSNSYNYIWHSGSGITNPLTGNAIASVDISCDSTAAKLDFACLKSGV